MRASAAPTCPWRLARYGVVVLFVAVAVWVATANGSVNDEFAAHVTAGYLYWKTGRFAGGVFNPPLGQLWVAWPLVLAGAPLFPFTESAPLLARLANVLLATACLWSLGSWVAHRVNEKGALMATVALVASPEFLGHASLATLELPISALMAWTTIGWIDALRRPSVRAWLATGLGLGAAVATKVSGLLLLPMGGAIALGHYARWGRLRRAVRRQGLDERSIAFVSGRLFALFGAAWLVIWTAHGFRHQQGSSSILSQLPSIARFFFPGEFLDQLLGKAAYASGGNLAYFAGQQRVGGWWWYYPVVFVLKTPLPLLLLWGWGAIRAFRRGPSRARNLAWAALAFAVCASFNKAQIGVRHLLPLAPLLALLCAWLVVSSCQRDRVVAWALAVGAVINAGWFLPYPLAAESALLGGRGWRVFADANVDWGQANARIRDLVERGEVRQPVPYAAESGRLVVRVNHLMGFRSPTRDGYAWLREHTPDQKVAGGGLIFAVPDDSDLSTFAAPPVRLAWILGRVAGRQSATMTRSEATTGPVTRRPTCRAVSREVEDLLELIEPSKREEAAEAWVRVVEENEPPHEAYELARRLARLWPDLAVAQEAEKRLRLLVEAERFAQVALARNAFARANAAWLKGDGREAMRWLRQALMSGAPSEPCAELGYQAACALGWWTAAMYFADELPPQRRSALQPPLALVKKCQEGELSAEVFPLAMWCYQQRAWPTAAALFAGILRHDPSHAQAFNMLGEMIVRYKEQTLRETELERAALERLPVGDTVKSH